MGWNHRVLAHDCGDEMYFQIHEVLYTDDIPDGYTEKGISVGGESISSLKWTLNKMKKCLSKPILWAGDRFPEEYIQNK